MNQWSDPEETELPSQRKVKREVPNNGSHGVTLNQSNKKRISQRISELSTSFHLTVQIRNKSLTTRHLRLMFEVLLYEIITKGVNFDQYLMLVHLQNLLFGSKSDPLELSDEHTRRLIILSMIIMKDLSGKEFQTIGQENYISENLKEIILKNNLIMNKRTYNSRRNHWNPEIWLTIKTVSVEEIIERNGNTERYSSYCKGYGESHPDAHSKKTKPSAEYDGKDVPIKEISLFEVQQLSILNLLIQRPKVNREKS